MPEDQLDLDFEIPVRSAGTGQIKRVTFGAAPTVKPRAPAEIVDEVIRKIRFPGGPDIQKRFRETVLARINDVRDAIETREELMRSADKGGLGVSAADVERIILTIEEVVRGKGGLKGAERGVDLKPAPKPAVVPPRPPAPTVVPVAKPTLAPLSPAKPPAPAVKSATTDYRLQTTAISSPAYPRRPVVSAPSIPKPAAPLSPAPPKPAAATTVYRPQTTVIPSPPTPSPESRVPSPVPAAAPPIQRDEVYEKLAEEVIRETGIALPPNIRHRLIVALVARLKDVRDSAETKDHITRPVAAGGVGLEAVAAERVLVSADLRFFKISEEMQRIERDRTLTALKRERDGEERRVELRKAGEEMARDELFASIAAKSKKLSSALPAPAISRPAPAVSAPATTPLRPAAPPLPLMRPKVLDVTPTQRLVGPVEELRVMTVSNFRKLARDPKEAGLKIRDKINLLQEESFEKRNAGISAWRESEPMKLYAELTANALEGKPVPAQIQERTTAGKPSLTQEEFTAIMDLNRILRF